MSPLIRRGIEKNQRPASPCSVAERKLFPSGRSQANATSVPAYNSARFGFSSPTSERLRDNRSRRIRRVHPCEPNLTVEAGYANAAG